MAWSYISAATATGSPGGSTSYNLAYAQNPAANSTLVAIANSGGSTDGITVSGGGLTWTQRILFSGTWALWEAPFPAGGALTVNFANGSGTFGGVGIFEFDNAAAAYESSGTGSGTSTSPAIGSFSTTSGDLLVLSLYPVSGANLTGLGGLTDTGTKVNGVSWVLWGTSSGSTSAFSGTLSFSDSWTVGMIAQKLSGGGGGTPLFASPTLSGLGSGGPFFNDRMGG